MTDANMMAADPGASAPSAGNARNPERQGRRPAHRAPSPDERLRDAERSRRLLLEAALDEFAAKGYSGARVTDIAARAGVNRQLISYYFGGKEGLYRELQGVWLNRESELSVPDVSLVEAVTGHLHEVLADPRLLRLGIWRGLTDLPQVPGDSGADREILSRARSRQDSGELAEDLDPAAVMLLMLGAVAIPVAMPQVVNNIFGADPSDPDFEEWYTEQLSRVIRRLALPSPASADDE